METKISNASGTADVKDGPSGPSGGQGALAPWIIENGSKWNICDTTYPSQEAAIHAIVQRPDLFGSVRRVMQIAHVIDFSSPSEATRQINEAQMNQIQARIELARAKGYIFKHFKKDDFKLVEIQLNFPPTAPVLQLARVPYHRPFSVHGAVYLLPSGFWDKENLEQLENLEKAIEEVFVCQMNLCAGRSVHEVHLPASLTPEQTKHELLNRVDSKQLENADLVIEFVNMCRRLGVDEQEVRSWTAKSLEVEYGVNNSKTLASILKLQQNFLDCFQPLRDHQIAAWSALNGNENVLLRGGPNRGKTFLIQQYFKQNPLARQGCVVIEDVSNNLQELLKVSNQRILATTNDMNWTGWDKFFQIVLTV